MAQNFKNMTIEDFTKELAGKAPVPGGGGASALIGSLGIALGNMVGSLTVGKKKYADVEEDIKAMMVKSENLIVRLQALIDEDAESFAPLAAAYSLPKETEEEKAHRAEVMAEALKTASLTPLKIMETVCEAIDVVEEYAAKGSKLAISDAGVAAIALRSALLGASLNVFINTGAMEDKALAEELEGRANKMIDTYGPKAEAIFAAVREKL